jgi:hypothetical protein
MSSNEAIPKRLVIYPKDIEIITGRSYRSACVQWNEIHKALNKSERQIITIRDFCDYMGIQEELVREFLK